MGVAEKIIPVEWIGLQVSEAVAVAVDEQEWGGSISLALGLAEKIYGREPDFEEMSEVQARVCWSLATSEYEDGIDLMADRLVEQAAVFYIDETFKGGEAEKANVVSRIAKDLLAEEGLDWLPSERVEYLVCKRLGWEEGEIKQRVWFGLVERDVVRRLLASG